MRSDLHGVADAILLSRATFGKTVGRTLFAFIYNVLGIPPAAFGMLNPVVAGAAMAMSLSVVSNAAGGVDGSQGADPSAPPAWTI